MRCGLGTLTAFAIVNALSIACWFLPAMPWFPDLSWFDGVLQASWETYKVL